MKRTKGVKRTRGVKGEKGIPGMNRRSIKGRNIIGRLAVLFMTMSFLMTGCGEKAAGVDGALQESTASESASENSSVALESADKESSSGESTEGEPAGDVAAVVRITINPDLELLLDKEAKILAVNYLNQDAEDAFSELELQGTELKDAVSLVVDAAIEKEYLKAGKEIAVEISAGEGKVPEAALSEEITDVINKTVQETLDNRQFDALLQITVAEAEEGQSGHAVEVKEEQTESKEGQAAKDSQTAEDGQTAVKDGQGSGESTEQTTQAETGGEPCPACGGTGICAECGGGTLPCKRCGGSLWEKCGTCGGSGSQTCPGCHGSGQDATDGSACRHCGGAGSITCEQCGGSGGKACSICNGKGVISDDCILCHGAKTCTVCGGTGKKQD